MTNEEINDLISNETIDLLMNCSLKPEKFTAYSLDPAAMFQVIIENGISISFYREQRVWMAVDDVINQKISEFSANPLRAAAIVYLKIKGVL